MASTLHAGPVASMLNAYPVASMLNASPMTRMLNASLMVSMLNAGPVVSMFNTGPMASLLNAGQWLACFLLAPFEFPSRHGFLFSLVRVSSGPSLKLALYILGFRNNWFDIDHIFH